MAFRALDHLWLNALPAVLLGKLPWSALLTALYRVFQPSWTPASSSATQKKLLQAWGPSLKSPFLRIRATRRFLKPRSTIRPSAWFDLGLHDIYIYRTRDGVVRLPPDAASCSTWSAKKAALTLTTSGMAHAMLLPGNEANRKPKLLRQDEHGAQSDLLSARGFKL
ncbi:hypothetical protein B0H15DRAFT_839158 [Mycena belliarum]|uniref:Uncharacterized protein n=1 Tax=Mycena belliarum TaxID=1033014 RepID=A0AAD6U3X6_9AGAR|nr:hypothetical protein B0H15DRAFT_839158 [Mycena belliae]